MEKNNYIYYGKKVKLYTPVITNSAVVKAIKSNRIWERKIHNLMIDYITTDHVVVDIGAYVGVHTIHMSHLAKKVYAFEPQRLVGKCLAQTIQDNDCLNNVVLNNVGLYSKKCLMKFVTDNDGDASVSLYRKRKFLYEYHVKMYKLDDFNLDQCDLIKLDAEGSEFEVLAGAMETIEKFHPIIIIEVWRTISRFNKLKEFAYNAGYDIKNINADNFLLIPNGYVD